MYSNKRMDAGRFGSGLNQLLNEGAYQSLFELNNNAILAIDLEGNIIKVNRAARNIVPSHLTEYIHTPIEDLISFDDSRKLYETIHSRDSHHFSGQVIQVRNEQLIKLEMTSIPIVLHEKVIGRFLQATDRTEELQEAQDLRTENAFWESFINHSADAIGLFDLNGNITKLNKATERIFQYSMEELLGNKVITIPNESYRKEVEFLQRKVKSGKSVVEYETVRMRKDGKLIDVSITYSPIYNKSGQMVAMANILRDISERKNAEELLRNSEKLAVIGQLAASIAHEIRNPLTSLKGFLQYFHANGDEYSNTFYELMLSEVERINLIVSEFLLLAKPQSAKFERTNMEKLFEHLLALVESQAIMENVEVQLHSKTANPSIVCDGNQLKQVFLNYLKNAIEACHSGGKVTVTLELEENDLIVRISDNGSGITKENLERIGTPFFTTKENGTGLGLMISERIISNHKGKVQFQSKNGVGTTVTITLPINRNGI